MNCFSNDHQGQRLTYCRMAIFAAVSLSILILLVYSNSFHCSWHFDDAPNITENPLLHMTRISWHSIKAALFSDRNNPGKLYRPVACLSFALNYYFGGKHVAGYHVVNIMIHLISSIFLFLFVYRTLTLPTLRGKYGPHAYFIALLSTVLWAINPVHTQAITYIVQRMASMVAMFYIIAMYWYLRARTSSTQAKRISFFALCVLFFCLALGSKENAAMFPLSILLYEVLILQPDPPQFFRKNFPKLLAALGLILFIGFGYLYIKTGNIFSFLNGYENRPFTLGQRLLTEPRVILSYISLLFYPMPNRLNIAHDFQISTSIFSPITTLLSILVLVVMVGGAILLGKRQRLISFSILFFFLNHIIESSIFPLELVFEHRNYLPSFFLFVPVAIGFQYLLDTFAPKTTMKAILCSFIILVLIGFGHSTFMRNFTWKNERSLWTDAAEKSPNLRRPHHNLGRYYQDHGYYDMAIKEYQKALESTSMNSRIGTFVTYYNLGKLYARKNDYETAKSFYDKAVSINSDFPPLYNDMAALFDRKGEYGLAHKYLAKALELSPQDLLATFNMGFYYLRQQQPEKAIFYLNRVVGNEDQFGDRVPLYLGIAFKQTGRLGRAAIFFQQAKSQNPKNIKARLHLGEIYFRTGERKKAEREIAEAIDLIPNEELFEKILRDLTGNGEMKNLQPNKDVIIPLMRSALMKKSKVLNQWAEELLN